jgi:hypothetical protein
MAARLVVACVGALALVLPFAGASDAVDAVAGMAELDAATVETTTPGSAVAGGEARSPVVPRMSPEMSQKNREQVTAAFQVALEKVREVPECRELFADLGTDGTATLGKVFFFPIGRNAAKGNVCRDAVAYTLVDGGPTWLCREFWRLTDERAAMVIIHEALHHAGLGEWPRDPDGMRSTAINDMVAKRCGL